MNLNDDTKTFYVPKRYVLAYFTVLTIILMGTYTLRQFAFLLQNVYSDGIFHYNVTHSPS